MLFPSMAKSRTARLQIPEPIGMTLISADAARQIAGENPRFDLFDSPGSEGEPGGMARGERSRLFPLVIALAPESLQGGVPGRDLERFLRHGCAGEGPAGASPGTLDECPGVSAPGGGGGDRTGGDFVRENPLLLVWGHRMLEGVAPGVRLPAVLVDIGAGEPALLRAALVREGRAGSYSWREMDRIYGVAREIGAGDPDDLVDPSRPAGPLVSRYRELPPVLQGALNANLLDLRTAGRAAGLPETLLGPLLKLSEPLSFSRRRQFLVATEELCRAGGDAPVGALLERLWGDSPGGLPGQLSGKGSGGSVGESSPALAEEAFREVMNHRYPRLRRLEAAVRAVQEGTLRGSGVRLEPPPRFEGSRYRISFEAGSVEELRRRLGAVQKMEQDLDGLLELLFQDPLDDSLAP